MRFVVKYAYFLFVCFFLIHTFTLSLFGIKIFGFRFFAVQTASMKPALSPGDLIVVHKEGQYTYLPGDIITFYSWETGKEQIITHRIQRIGGNVYVTKGDVNEATDAEPVRPRFIIGRVIFLLPFLGNYILISKTQPGLILTVFLPALFILIKEMGVVLLFFLKERS